MNPQLAASTNYQLRGGIVMADPAPISLHLLVTLVNIMWREEPPNEPSQHIEP